jgi:hypothetical protein
MDDVKTGMETDVQEVIKREFETQKLTERLELISVNTQASRDLKSNIKLQQLPDGEFVYHYNGKHYGNFETLEKGIENSGRSAYLKDQNQRSSAVTGTGAPGAIVGAKNATETSLNPVLAGIDAKTASNMELTVEEAKALNKICNKDAKTRRRYKEVIAANFDKITANGQKYTGVYR